MATSLYLDTARLGRMSPRAQLAHTDFVRLAGEEAGSLYFDDFLRHGHQAWPAGLQRRFPGLAGWKGVVHLKSDLKRLAGTREESRLLLANRTSRLMRFAARLFYGRCRNVLITDLTWPSYEQLLRRQARKSGNQVTRYRIREDILHGRVSAAELINDLATAFQQHRCDGLFLPAVDNCGIRLPVAELTQEIRRRTELRFVVIDGAQAFGHVPVQLAADDGDLFIAGCHKWLRAYHPMGLGFFGSPRSQDYIEATLESLTKRDAFDDPLLCFSEDLQHGRVSPFGETVSLASLFSCRGALDDILAGEESIANQLSCRLSNSERLLSLAKRTGWTVLRPQIELRTGIVVLQSAFARIRAIDPVKLRRRFMSFGVAVTVYPHGRVRMSMPDCHWRPAELALLAAALESASHIHPQQNSEVHCGFRWNTASPVAQEFHP